MYYQVDYEESRYVKCLPDIRTKYTNILYIYIYIYIYIQYIYIFSNLLKSIYDIVKHN